MSRLDADPPPRLSYTTAVDALAASVVRAFRGADDTYRISDHVGLLPDRRAELAALRVLGVDALTPFLVRNRPVLADDLAVFDEVVTVFPSDSTRVTTSVVRRLRHWFLEEVLTELTGAGKGTAYPRSADELAPNDGTPWQPWSVFMAQVSTMALPGWVTPVHLAASRRTEDLARGAARALLRGDPYTAARLARWLALQPDVPPELGLAGLLEHVDLLAARDPRTQLEVAVAQHLLEVGRS
ncbi:hypothetical protein [Actinoalloteichus spitiensis]|uniref:hypothetical protein n=1 Tax=Actinoalloteichus spitiensis TaxID=252394 RepID=UPI0012F63279|nr:hypothetical protein [Actinoalloteichus spitiensis]